MWQHFPLFQSHIDLAHDLWKSILQPGDIAIDATCGNGNDTLVLSKVCLQNNTGKIYAIDIQDSAINKAQLLLQEHLSNEQMRNIHFIKKSHAEFPKDILEKTVRAIVYNLGYLPGGNKTFTTQCETTLQSIHAALPLLKEGGIISITCYPGHPEGKKEENVLLNFLKVLKPNDWSSTHFQWVNRNNSPSLILIQYRLS